MSVETRSATVSLNGNLAGLSLGRQVAVLAFWPLLEQVLAFTVGLTDQYISGHIAQGAEKTAILDAMGLGAYVGWFFNILQVAVATGVLALVSRATGARDPQLANRGLGQGVWLGIAAGVLSLIMIQVGIPVLVHGVKLTPEAAVQAERFLRVLSLSGPFSGAMFAINAALRASGDTRTPFYGMVAVNLVNMGSNWLLAFGPPPFGQQGVAGIAGSTVCGWIAGLMVVALAVGKNQRSDLHWARMAFRWHGETMRRILRIGVPQALEIAGMWLISIFSLRMISSMAVDGALGAHQIAIRIESMSFLPGFAIGGAAATLAGQYLGAGSREMAMQAVRLCWKLAAVVMGTMGLVFVLGREPLVSWMSNGSSLHLHLTTPLLVVTAITQPLFGTCIVLKTAMRGAGATPLVIRWSFGSMLFYRVLVLWLMLHAGQLTLTRVWIVFGCDCVTQGLIFAWVFFRGRWMDAKV